MPNRALRFCTVPGCPARVPSGRCQAHEQRDRRERYQRNAESLYDARWKRESAAFLRAHRQCVDCGEPAQVTDHSIAHKGDVVLFWDHSLWVARCWSCHSRKTVREDGGFGRDRGAAQKSARQPSFGAPWSFLCVSKTS